MSDHPGGVVAKPWRCQGKTFGGLFTINAKNTCVNINGAVFTDRGRLYFSPSTSGM
jgi:hypothetical protein